MFTKKEIKLIEKALLNQKMGKGEQKTVESIYAKLDNIKNDGVLNIFNVKVIS